MKCRYTTIFCCLCEGGFVPTDYMEPTNICMPMVTIYANWKAETARECWQFVASAIPCSVTINFSYAQQHIKSLGGAMNTNKWRTHQPITVQKKKKEAEEESGGWQNMLTTVIVMSPRWLNAVGVRLVITLTQGMMRACMLLDWPPLIACLMDMKTQQKQKHVA